MDAKATLTTLARLASRRPDQITWFEQCLQGRMEALAEVAIEVAIEAEAPVGPILARQIERERSPELILRLAATCDTKRYSHSFALRDVALVSARAALDLYQELGEEALALIESADVTRLASNLSQRLLSLGLNEEALWRARQAVELARALVAAGPHLEEPLHEEMLPYLVGSLIALANSLATAGLLEESLDAGREAASIAEEFHRRAPEAWKGLHAGTLANLGFTLNKLSRYQDALDINRHAVQLSREATRLVAESLVFPPPLAAGLINHGLSLIHLGREAEALEAAREASSLIRELWHERPDIFLPTWIEVLEQLVTLLSLGGSPDEALAIAHEVTRQCEGLAQNRSNYFRPHYAFSLLNLSSILWKTGQAQEALAAARRATLQFRLAEPGTSGFYAAMAQSISNLSGILLSLGRREEALEEAKEAIAVLQSAPSSERISSYDYGYCLYNLGLARSQAGELPAAISSLDEAVSQFRKATEGRLYFADPRTAKCLRLLGSLYAKDGRHEIALEVTREGLDLVRSLAEQRPQVFRRDLAESLGHLGNRLADLGQLGESLATHEEAVRIHREIRAMPSLAYGLNNLGQVRLALGLVEEAITALEEGMTLIAPSFLENPYGLLDIACALAENYRDAMTASGAIPDHQLLSLIHQALGDLAGAESQIDRLR